MKVKPYEKLSLVYNGLMKNVDYTKWSKYILEIAGEYVDDGARILELAAGNCKMADIITRRYKNFIGTDISLSMLKTAKNNKLRKICCDMTELPLKIKFDFIFSAFDSVNYILKQKTLFRLFKEVYLILKDNGIFTFDVSLENNSLNFLVEKMTDDYYTSFSFTRTNKYNKRNRIHYNSFIITHDSGSEIKEVHKQKIYDIRTYFKLAEEAGLSTEACYDCFTFNDVNRESERAQFVMRKANQ
jgi:ubiquinone/menaquinone biosynthesis C-methylase UbiE